MNRREFLRLAGVFVAGTMIQPQIPINWFYKPPTRPAPTMPSKLAYEMGRVIGEGYIDGFNYVILIDLPITGE